MTLCHYWVVDLVVPFNSSGTGHDTRRFWVETASTWAGGDSKEECRGRTEQTFVYVKHPGATTFTRIAGGIRQTEWVNVSQPHQPPSYICFLLPDSVPNLEQPLSPPGAGTDVYRFVMTLNDKGTHVPMSFSAWHETIPW